MAMTIISPSFLGETTHSRNRYYTAVKIFDSESEGKPAGITMSNGQN